MVTHRDFVVHLSRKPRIAGLLSAFVGAGANVIGVSDVGVRLVGGRPDPAVLKRAESSSNRPRQTKSGLTLKRLFLTLQYRWGEAVLKRNPEAGLVVWNGIKGHRSLLTHAAQQMGREVFFFEESPIPKRVAIDREGVNFGSSLPRDPAFYLAWLRTSGVSPHAWRKIVDDIVPRCSESRDDVKHDAAPDCLEDETFIFCPLQVPGDSQISVFGDWIESVDHMIDALKTASESLPEGWHLRIKEHPSAKVSFGEKLAALEGAKFRVDNTTNTMQQVELSQAVLNVNSSVGLQAFFFDKPVIVMGWSFYGFSDLAIKVDGPADLARTLSAPEHLSYNKRHRNAFMSYLCEAYYPAEQDVLAGRYGLDDVRKRDLERDRILAALPQPDYSRNSSASTPNKAAFGAQPR